MNSTPNTLSPSDVINPPTTELSELIARAQKYMGTRFGHFLSDEQMFEMWSLTLDRIDELAAFGDPAFSVEKFVADTIPGMLVQHWMTKYRDTVLMPARKLMKRSGIPASSTDHKEVENDVWGILIPQWFRHGAVHCLGKNLPIKALQGFRIEDLRECSCYPMCKCPKDAPMSFQRALYELAKHAAGHWRTRHRSRDRVAEIAQTKAKRAAAKSGIVYIAPPKVNQSEIVWKVRKPENLGDLDAYTGIGGDVDYNGIPRRFKGAGEDADIANVPTTILAQRATPTKGNKSDADTIQSQRWAEGCSTHKSYRFADDDEGRAALEDWKRLPHNTVRDSVTVAEVSQDEVWGNYFRDLSENYSDYCSGFKPWPVRPEGLVLVEPSGSKYPVKADTQTLAA